MLNDDNAEDRTPEEPAYAPGQHHRHSRVRGFDRAGAGMKCYPADTALRIEQFIRAVSNCEFPEHFVALAEEADNIIDEI